VQTQTLSQTSLIPQHIAIIMDGNGRWARARGLPRAAGHKAGVDCAKRVVRSCGERGVKVLTLFAFSSENWRRPKTEINTLMRLFSQSLINATDELHQNNVQIKFIGELTGFNKKLQSRMQAASELTKNNSGLCLVIALNYGGRWDIMQAVKVIAERVGRGELSLAEITDETFSAHLSSADLPEPDLLIRTSGELRMSNFLLWQLAYTELYFTETLWPDFDEAALGVAIDDFGLRQRRFGAR